MLAAGEIARWTPQERVTLRAYGRKVAVALVDFRVQHNDGSVELVEVKGHAERHWLFKRRLIEAWAAAEATPTRYSVVGRDGAPWTPPKRRKRFPRLREQKVRDQRRKAKP